MYLVVWSKLRSLQAWGQISVRRNGLNPVQQGETSDISATIKGKAIHIEIKVGKDKPSEHQITMQERIRSAGGVYEFIGDMESFMSLYDKILSDK